MRKINSKKLKKALRIYDDKDMLITTDEEQLEAITKFFEDMFYDENSETIEITPAPMEPPYSGEKIEKAALKLKNNKGTGRDEVKAEFMKYGPKSLHDQIAGLLQKNIRNRRIPRKNSSRHPHPARKASEERCKSECTTNHSTIRATKDYSYHPDRQMLG